ncbi:hypothetical protein HYALB_00004602 [Hymenoscyphus albidus]|uniref:Uncharacterized protein n=1 Tax=Hymenoscyphus albidus TaxID=595503 RepID=A0A9N9QDI6_9HELO|nr:hypothetical protein HYALB_00004602 [Hymenoscyphus albidus]
MSLHTTQLNALTHTPETALRLPIQLPYYHSALYKNSWGLNWEYLYRQDRAFANRSLYRFPIPRPPLPPHMASQERRPILLPNEYLDHHVVSRLPIDPPLSQLVYEPEPEPRVSKWVYFWHSFNAAVPIWALQKAWSSVWGWVIEGIRAPVNVAVWVWESINWYAIFWLMISFQVVKVVVPAFALDEEVEQHTSKPLNRTYVRKLLLNSVTMNVNKVLKNKIEMGIARKEGCMERRGKQVDSYWD